MKSLPPADSAPPVLVVDADPLLREKLTATLAAEGFPVLTAANRHQAAAAVLEHDVQVVLMNMLMPHAEGIGTLIAVRAVNPDIRVIAMSPPSCDGADHFMPLAKSLGATTLLRNPLDPSALLRAVHGSLEASPTLMAS